MRYLRCTPQALTEGELSQLLQRTSWVDAGTALALKRDVRNTSAPLLGVGSASRCCRCTLAVTEALKENGRCLASEAALLAAWPSACLRRC